MNMVAEGVKSSPSVLDLARRYGVEMPITEQVVAVCHEGRSARDALDGADVADEQERTGLAPPMITTGVTGRPWRASITDGVAIEPWDDAPTLELVRRRRRSVARRRRRARRSVSERVEGTPVTETRLRVPSGDVVQRIYSVADAGGLTIVEFENESPMAVARSRSTGATC